MTHEAALEQFKVMFPERADKLAVEYNVTIWDGAKERFYLWDHSSTFGGKIVASSERSWGHALALAKIEQEWPEPEPVKEPVDA